MPKRFTDSAKFRDPWYRKLPPKIKCLWEYLLSECDIAGIIDIDLDAASFHIGDDITQDDMNCLGDRIYYLEKNKIFIPKFVQFQQVSLNPENRAHKGIISIFEKYNIPLDLNMSEFTSPFEGALKGLQSPIGISNSNSIGNSNINKKRENFLNEAVEAYNSIGLPKVQKLSQSRKAKLKSRLKDCDGIDGWIACLEKVKASDFLMGRSKDWKADFDFIITESKFIKIMEGVYDNAKANKINNIQRQVKEIEENGW